MKKLAFCFLIYGEIECEELWYIYFSRIDPAKYNIYIHYKDDKPLKFFEKNKLKNCIETRCDKGFGHGATSLIRAYNVMFEEALKDTENEMCILLSGTCVPLKPFHLLYSELDTTKSYFNICPQTHCFPRCDSVLSKIDREFIQKSAVFSILNRKHVELLCKDRSYFEWFDEIPCGDEHCYISALFYHKLENELILTKNETFGTTFVNWKDCGYKYSFGYEGSTYGNKNYKSISKEELEYILQSSSFFGRKFLKECLDDFIMGGYISFILSDDNISMSIGSFKDTKK